MNPLFHLAPRRWLRRRELDHVPEPSAEKTYRALESLQSLRIALVKQEVMAAMPNLPGKHAMVDFLKSAGGHTGCLSLLHELGAELVLVREDFAPECQTWREKVSFDADPARLENIYRNQAREMRYWTPRGPRSLHEMAVPAHTVDWGKFDLVVALDIPIPEKIVRAHPRTVWAYMITETAMPSYSASRRTPLFGYDLFLNQKCRLHSVRPSNRWHEIDFPWAFQTSGCYGQVAPNSKPGILLDPHTSGAPEILALEKSCGLAVRAPRGLVAIDWIHHLRASRYLIRLTEKRNWGNLSVEAACAGSLVLADPVSLENPAPLLRELVVRSPVEAAAMVRKLEEDPLLRNSLVDQQQARVYELAFARPLRELWQKVKTVRKNSCQT